jgi:hypothetical protein
MNGVVKGDLGDKPVMESELMKKNDRTGKWAKWFVRLHNSGLRFFKRKGDMYAKGEVVLSAEHYVSDLKASSEKLANVFIVSDFEVTYYLAADSIELRDFWMHAVARIIRNLQQRERWFDSPAPSTERSEADKRRDLEARMAAYNASKGAAESPSQSPSSASSPQPHKPPAGDAARLEQQAALAQLEKGMKDKEAAVAKQLELKRVEAEKRLRAAEEAERKALEAVQQAEVLAREAQQRSKDEERKAKEQQQRQEEQRQKSLELKRQKEEEIRRKEEEIRRAREAEDKARKEAQDKAAAAERMKKAEADKARAEIERAKAEAARKQAEREALERAEQQRKKKQDEDHAAEEAALKVREEAAKAASAAAAAVVAARKPEPQPAAISTPQPAPQAAGTPALTSLLRRLSVKRSSVPRASLERPASPPKQPPAAAAAAVVAVSPPAVPLAQTPSMTESIMSGITSRLAQWNQKVEEHEEKQANNVFSAAYKGGDQAHPKPSAKDANYGKPPPGSKSEVRAAAAAKWVEKEVDKLIDEIKRIGYKDQQGRSAVKFITLFHHYE